eukprot:6199918-Pleurochrysis_carterae.AAC.1
MRCIRASGAGRLVVGERPSRFRRRKRGLARGMAVWRTGAPRKGERRAKQKAIKRGVDAVVEPDDSQRGAVSSESTRGCETMQRCDDGLGVDARKGNWQRWASCARRRPTQRDHVSSNSKCMRATSSNRKRRAEHGGRTPPCGRARRIEPPTAASVARERE